MYDAGSLREQPVTARASPAASASGKVRRWKAFIEILEVKGHRSRSERQPGLRESFESEAAHEIVQRGTADAEELGGARKVPVDAREHAHQRVLLGRVTDLAQVERVRILLGRHKSDVSGGDARAFGHDHRALDGALELAHVSRPGV